MLNVVKNTIKFAGGCPDLTTCGGSTTRIDLQSVEIGGRMLGTAVSTQEPHFTLSNIGKGVKK